MDKELICYQCLRPVDADMEIVQIDEEDVFLHPKCFLIYQGKEAPIYHSIPGPSPH